MLELATTLIPLEEKVVSKYRFNFHVCNPSSTVKIFLAKITMLPKRVNFIMVINTSFDRR